ncbi:hypothetical protein HAZT_HAZT009602, partial [Hyalella azteca]
MEEGRKNPETNWKKTLLDKLGLSAHKIDLDSVDLPYQQKKLIMQTYYTKHRKSWMSKKPPIRVTVNPPSAHTDEKITIVVKDEHPTLFNIKIQNITRGNLTLLLFEKLYECDNIILRDKNKFCSAEAEIELEPGAAYSIKFSALYPGKGCYEVPVFLQFVCRGKERKIEHQMFLLCIDYLPEDVPEISAEAFKNDEESKIERRRKAPSVPTPPHYSPGREIEGREPSANFKYLFRYPDYLRKLVVENFNPEFASENSLKASLQNLEDIGKQGLTHNNYGRWFELQLWIEEIEREINLQYYHLDGVDIEVNEGEHGERMATLHVPGVAEKHPAILAGDSVFVRLPSDQQPSWPYEGIVHDVINETLHLGFGEEFFLKYSAGMKVNVQFWFCRSIFIRCHKVLKHYQKVLPILFPKHSTRFDEANLVSVDNYFDKNVGKNRRQRQAVEAIVNRVSAPAPYIIFGPPGTGKTSTMVEAIKQVYTRNKDDNILVCGPSNASCDILTEGLLKHIPASKILRVNALSRSRAGIAKNVWNVSSHEGNFSLIPSMDMVRSYNIVITTYSTAYYVMPLTREKNNECGFTYVFLDESGYTTEPEALIPLLALPKMVILAGDPYQLGPVVSNLNPRKISLFKGFRMDQSFLGRLMTIDMYKPKGGQFNPLYITKLVENFRSHKSLLEIPNRCFYENQLKARGDNRITNSMLKWAKLPNPKIPIIFHGVNGREKRKANNPSFFNVFEMAQVVEYVEQLMHEMNIEPKNIGIVTPYREQMKKIREALSSKFGRVTDELRIGTPEVFQGDERLVVIVSTVRANPERLITDDYISAKLGFLSNPKRFNVAITRARALLVVIGYPWLLEDDKYWGKLLEFCCNEGCYTGIPYDRHSDLANIEKKFDRLHI